MLLLMGSDNNEQTNWSRGMSVHVKIVYPKMWYSVKPSNLSAYATYINRKFENLRGLYEEGMYIYNRFCLLIRIF